MPRVHPVQDAFAAALLHALPCKRTRLGLRRPVRCSATLFAYIVGLLRQLGDGPETPAARVAVQEVLHTPYWGLRVVAVEVIGRWGGPRNKAWLLTGAVLVRRRPANKEARWQSVQAEAARAALAALLTPGDTEWLLDRWFDDWLHFGSLHRAFHHVPDAAVADRIRRELANADAARRTAALWLAYHRRSMAERTEFIRLLADDADAAVRTQALKMLRWIGG